MWRNILDFLKGFLSVVFAVVAILVIYLGIKIISINNARKQVSDDYEISEIREYTLGGIKQKVLVEGKSKDLPVVIYLHGGPGIPMPYNVGSRGLFPEITDKNIFVVWDQYGCGINKAPLDKDFKIETIYEMSKDLVREIKKDFPDQKLTVFGVSWGSYLSARLATEMPELIDSVLVYGQITSDLTLNEEVFEALRKSDLPKKDKEKLELIAAKDEFDIEDALLVSGWINLYTQGLVAEGTSMWDFVPKLIGQMFSPDYKLKDGFAIMDNDYDDNRDFLKQMYALDLRPLLKEVSIPYTILQGEHDLVTSTKAIKELVESTNNPNLKIKIFPNSSHTPSQDTLAEVIQFDKYR